jgi:hypothetical protein
MNREMNCDSAFKLVVTDYKMAYSQTNTYYDNNWLEGYVEINGQLLVKLELLQVEELLAMKKWIEGIEIGGELQPDFVFIDSFVRFKQLIRGNYPYVKFIFDEDEKNPIIMDINIDEIGKLGTAIISTSLQFPLRLS